MPAANDKKQHFIDLLHELFQLDQPELDFGFYKIMHAKSGQITRFIDEELSTHIDAVFAGRGNQAAEEKVAQARQAILGNVDANAFEHGELKAEHHGSPAGQRFLQAQRELREGGALSDEAQVYDHLYRFFSRYYDEGDFLSTRYRQSPSDTRDAPYSVPYDGREVYLHWANKDQYYIKSSETLRNYGFDLNTAVRQLGGDSQQSGLDLGDDATPRRVQFQIVDAAEGAHGNVKENEQRFFLIHEAEPITLGDDELTIQFEYRPDPDKSGQNKKWQETRLAEAEAAVFAALDAQGETGTAFKQALATPAPTDKDQERTLLAKYLTKYTTRHTMDYFIHKDLGGFLRRELDFYIKNEVMRLDHIEAADAPAVSDYLEKVKVIRRIARRIIEFLAQLEDFQKKLWLKKKFVTETNYCITLDRIPEEFYPEIAANERQVKEWGQLYSISELAGYSRSPTEAFLRNNKLLSLDTELFDSEFKLRLVSEIENFDSKINGTLFHAENFQSLELMQFSYANSVQCVYTDPPYNTNSSAIPYKNNYRHSSWGTLMHDRLDRIRPLVPDTGAVFVSIDKAERTILEHAMDAVFDADNRVEELIWAMNTNNSQAPNYSTNHEYIEVYAKHRPTAEQDRQMFREPKPGYLEVSELVEELNPKYPPISEIEQAIKDLYEEHIIEYRTQIEAAGLEWTEEKKNDPWKGLYNYCNAEYRNKLGQLLTEAEAESKAGTIWVWRESDASMPATKQAKTTRDRSHKNWRYYKPIHPTTGKECQHPKSGWKFPFGEEGDDPNRRTFKNLDADARIVWGKDNEKIPQLKRILHEVETNVGQSVFSDYSDGEKQTSAMFGESGIFLAPKHSNFVSRFILHGAKNDSHVLDCFGGSGSTAQAVVELNREDGGSRKYILVEMGDYFDTVLKPRLQKVVFSKDWKDGKPKPDADGNFHGVSHCFKYLRLESYEDALNNLVLHADADREAALEENEDLRHDYLLRYWLDTETAGSASLLNVEQFRDPTNYRMKIKRPGGDESVEQPVDLVETFNWLIGLHVELLDKPRTFTCEFEREADPDLPEDAATRLRVNGRLKEREDGPFWFRMVEGWVARTPGSTEDVDKVMVIWRKLTDNAEEDAAALESLLANQLRINQRDTEFDAIYINGPHGLSTDFDGKHRLHSLEEAFHAAMWAMD